MIWPIYFLGVRSNGRSMFDKKIIHLILENFIKEMIWLITK